MEKRISSTEYRLGIYESWPLDFQNVRKKFYIDSLRINLLLQQVFSLIQKQCNILIPYSIINVYINNKIININYGYFPLAVEYYSDSNFENNENISDDENEVDFADSDIKLKTKILPLLQTKLKKNYGTKNKKKLPKLFSKKKLLIRLFRINKKDKNPIFIDTVKDKKELNKILKIKQKDKLKRKKRLKFFKWMLKYIFKKWHRFILEQIFAELFKKQALVQNVNLKTYFLIHYNQTRDTRVLFDSIKDWYKKIGGNTSNFTTQILPLHYSLIYKNFMPLILLKLRNELEENPYKHRFIMTAFYNLLSSYKVMQANLTGFKLTFKGAIGQHGRTKTLDFFFGRLYTFTISAPVEYCAANANTIFGTIGIRWWINFEELLELTNKNEYRRYGIKAKLD